LQGLVKRTLDHVQVGGFDKQKDIL